MIHCLTKRLNSPESWIEHPLTQKHFTHLSLSFIISIHKWPSFNPWTSCQIHKNAGHVCARKAGNVFTATVGWRSWCTMHVLWCTRGSLTSDFIWRRWGENVLLSRIIGSGNDYWFPRLPRDSVISCLPCVIIVLWGTLARKPPNICDLASVLPVV